MASTFPFFFAPPTHTQSSVRAQATYEGLLPEGLERHSMSAASANINRCTLPPPRKPTSPDEFGELHALVITLMQMPQLPSRPAFVEDPLFAHGMFYREDRAAAGTRRRYTAPSMTIELDSWSRSGGATKTRFAIPEHLQAGDEPQVLVRRAGTVLRTGRATLRFHQYTVEPRVGAGNPVLYHGAYPQQHPAAASGARSSELTLGNIDSADRCAGRNAVAAGRLRHRLVVGAVSGGL